MMSVKLVNLSNYEESKKSNKSGINSYYCEEYRGLDVVSRAKKAALAVSDNGKCWWIYDFVYRELTWRNPKCD